MKKTTLLLRLKIIKIQFLILFELEVCDILFQIQKQSLKTNLLEQMLILLLQYEIQNCFNE